MTDKQIIIDGVDVSGCEFYNKDDKTCREANGKYNIDICDFDKCENSNCYYKNWKRKEQECERLKDIIETKLEDANICDTGLNYINDEYIFVKRQLDQLKAENEGLKRLIAKQKNAKIQLSKLKDKQYKEFCDMKQTLIEIKKVCNSVKNIENVNSLYDAKLSGMYLQAKQILQKIKECEVENEQ